MHSLNIVFENQNFVIIDKQAGLLSQGDSSGDESVVSLLSAYLGRPYVGLVHRLDRNVSGLMVVAKRTKPASRLTEMLQNGSLKRTYQGLVWGRITETKTLIHDLDRNESTRETFVRKSKTSKRAELTMSPMRLFKAGDQFATLCSFVLDTGRTHQIRVQTSYEGFPLVGDPKYGNAKFDQFMKVKRPALHSCGIEFPRPVRMEPGSDSDLKDPQIYQFYSKFPEDCLAGFSPV